MNISVEQPTLILRVDNEHGALRFSIIVIFVALWLVGFAISNALIPSAGLNLIAGLVGFGVAAIGGRLIEPYLKARWPSGRTVQLNEDGVRLSFRGQLQEEIKSNEAVSAMFWRFKVPRRGRIPKGWYVAACALEQDDRYLPVYAFVSPEQCELLLKITRFSELMSEKAAKNVKQDSLRIAGEQRRLRTAESYRWNNGAEMTFEDFQRFIERLNVLFPQWLP